MFHASVNAPQSSHTKTAGGYQRVLHTARAVTKQKTTQREQLSQVASGHHTISVQTPSPSAVALSLTHSLSLSPTLSLSLSHTQSLTHSHTHTHTLSLSPSLSLSLSLLCISSQATSVWSAQSSQTATVSDARGAGCMLGIRSLTLARTSRVPEGE